MDDQKQQEDRWRELADLLGLSDDERPAATSAAPVAAVAPPTEVPAIKAYEEPRLLPVRIEEETPPSAIHQEEDAPTIPMTRDEPMADWEGEFDEEEDDTPLDEAEEPSTESAAMIGGGPLPAGEEEKPRRGRRRRRRGRRRGGADKAEGDQPNRAPAASEPPARQTVESAPARPTRETEPDPRDRRGPRRGPRREEEVARRPTPVRQERREPEPAHADDLDDGQGAASNRGNPLSVSDTDFSDWNVPSWQDLISSLYRPDR